MSDPKNSQGVIDYLHEHGPVEDPAGRATAKFREELKFKGSSAAFTQMIAVMENQGTLARSVRGKRTYRIALAEQGNRTTRKTGKRVDSPSPAVEAEVDYDQLAAALLTRVIQSVSTSSTENGADGPLPRRQAQRLERENGQLTKELARTKSELKKTIADREDLREKLENCESNLALLTDQLSTPKPKRNAAMAALKAEDRELLNQLLSPESNERTS